MSYILDALRKADAQRERDPARGIHAQPARAAMGQGPQRAGHAPWIWAAAAAGVAVLAAGGWYLFRDGPAPAQATVHPAAVAVEAARPALAPPPAAPSVPAPVVAAQAVMPPPVVVAPPVQAAALPAAPPPAAAAAPVAGLPADAPKLAISGGVYSADKAQRMLIVNGQVVREGADVGSGVTLEEIKPKTAVLRFRGARYSVGY